MKLLISLVLVLNLSPISAVPQLVRCPKNPKTALMGDLLYLICEVLLYSDIWLLANYCACHEIFRKLKVGNFYYRITKEYQAPTTPTFNGKLVDFSWDKNISYDIFTDFSCWFQPYKFQNDPMAEIRGQPVLGHPWPNPPTCFGSNDGGFEPFVTAKTGRRAWLLSI